MQITILVESTEPLTGRVVAAADDLLDAPRTDIQFMGWLSLLRVLDDLFGSSSKAPRSVE